MKFEKIVPSVFYANIKDSYTLFVDCLDFKIVHDESDSSPPYYVIKKDDVEILVFENKEIAENDKPLFRMVTKNIEEVFSKISSSHPELLHPNLNTISLRPWGAKEFAIKDNQVGFVFQEW